jgi:hypothetical protein
MAREPDRVWVESIADARHVMSHPFVSQDLLPVPFIQGGLVMVTQPVQDSAGRH